MVDKFRPKLNYTHHNDNKALCCVKFNFDNCTLETFKVHYKIYECVG